MKRIFVSGLAVIIPIALTLWVLFAVFGTLDNFINTYLQLWFGFSFAGLGIVLAIFTIMLTGLITSTRIGGWFYRLTNRLIDKFPFVNKVYKLAKETVDVVTTEKAFKTVVMVEFPKDKVYSIGFLTNENTVFIPTTPNPTSGFLIKTEKYEIIDMDVESALKYIVSMGSVVTPKNIKLKGKK